MGEVFWTGEGWVGVAAAVRRERVQDSRRVVAEVMEGGIRGRWRVWRVEVRVGSSAV